MGKIRFPFPGFLADALWVSEVLINSHVHSSILLFSTEQEENTVFPEPGRFVWSSASTFPIVFWVNYLMFIPSISTALVF